MCHDLNVAVIHKKKARFKIWQPPNIFKGFGQKSYHEDQEMKNHMRNCHSCSRKQNCPDQMIVTTWNQFYMKKHKICSQVSSTWNQFWKKKLKIRLYHKYPFLFYDKAQYNTICSVTTSRSNTRLMNLDSWFNNYIPITGEGNQRSIESKRGWQKNRQWPHLIKEGE